MQVVEGAVEPDSPQFTLQTKVSSKPVIEFIYCFLFWTRLSYAAVSTTRGKWYGWFDSIPLVMTPTLRILKFNISKFSKTLFKRTKECSNYDRYCNHEGYGEVQFRHNKLKYNIKAQRASYMLYNNVNLKTSDVIMHTCDNPKCVNSKHLKKGTHNDNVQDRVKKKRSATGKNNGRYKHGLYLRV
jgi:hypothetical protein